MKIWIHAAEDYYTSIISEDCPEAIGVFMDTPKDNLDMQTVEHAVQAFFGEYKSLPREDDSEYDDSKYDQDKGRFYRKYKPFADKCKSFANRLQRCNKYGRHDFVLGMLRGVGYCFPHEWEVFAR